MLCIGVSDTFITIIDTRGVFHYLSGEIVSNSALFSAFVCILNEANECVRCVKLMPEI